MDPLHSGLRLKYEDKTTRITQNPSEKKKKKKTKDNDVREKLLVCEIVIRNITEENGG